MPISFSISLWYILNIKYAHIAYFKIRSNMCNWEMRQQSRSSLVSGRWHSKNILGRP